MRLQALMPWWVVYGMARLLSFLAGRVVKYRRDVIMQNLRSALPDRSEREIRRLTHQFYDFLADYFMETAKMSGMSTRQIKKRMQFKNFELINDILSSGQDVVLMLGHYGNWEWVSSLPLHLSVPAMAGQIYHPLSDKISDEAFLRLRGRYGAVSIPMAETLRTMLGWRREGKRQIVGFIADQAPRLQDTHLWVDFLNHDTGFYTGGEKIARKLNAAMVYLDMHRIKRGHYLGEMRLISRNLSELPALEPTRIYTQMLQESILRYPPMWLWSHKRWKNTHARFLELYGDQASERTSHL